MKIKTAIVALCIILLSASPFSQKTFAASDTPSVETMLGQMIMAGFRGDGQEKQEDIPYVKELIRQGKIGGVILFDVDAEFKGQTRNILNQKQLKKLTKQLQAEARIPLFIAVDQEGGKVQRLKPKHGFKKWPSASEMGPMGEKFVMHIGYQMGEELANAGINLNFAPSLDVDINPASPAIGAVERSFSINPATVANMGKAYMTGLNIAGVIGCFKHFPGHGSASGDTHLGATDITKTWLPPELEPYRKLLGMEGNYGVMVAHVYHETMSAGRPATLSKEVIDGILRKELGWNGVVFSDDMQMGAITSHYNLKEALLLGVNAGLDVFVFGNNLVYKKTVAEDVHSALLELYREGKISTQRIQESYSRIMLLKKTI